MNHTEHVLLFNLKPQDRLAGYTDLLSRLGIAWTVIDPSLCENTLGSLLGFSGYPAPEQVSSEPLPGEMLILSGFSDLRLDTLLKSIRKAGLQPVALKAVVTQTNVNWPLKTLYGHLLLEHMQMTGRS